MTDSAQDQIEFARRLREEAAKRAAMQTGKSFAYIDDDGCEVTVTSGGHVFFNAGDWY